MRIARLGRWWLFVVVAAGFSVLVPGGGPTRAATSGTIRLALGTAPPDPSSLFFYFAKQQGFFDQQGVTVQISTYNGDTTAIRALIAGEADVAWTGCNSAFQAIEAGAAFRVISAFAPKVSYSLVGNVGAGVNSIKDLEGHSVGVSTVGSVSWLVPKLMVEGAGATWNKINILTIGGSSARLQALVAQKIDGAVLDQPFVARTRNVAHLKVIAEAIDTLPNFLFVCEVTKEASIKSMAPALEAFEAAAMQGIRWFEGHGAEALAIARTVLPDTDADQLSGGLKYFAEKRYWNAEGEVSQSAFEYSIRVSVDTGALKTPLAYSRVIDTQIVRAAQAKVRK